MSILDIAVATLWQLSRTLTYSCQLGLVLLNSYAVKSQGGRRLFLSPTWPQLKNLNKMLVRTLLLLKKLESQKKAVIKVKNKSSKKNVAEKVPFLKRLVILKHVLTSLQLTLYKRS